MQVHELDQFISIFCNRLDADTDYVVTDAVHDMFGDSEDFRMAILKVICRRSDYWTEQIARTILGLKSDQTEEFASFLKALHEMDGQSGLYRPQIQE